MPSKIPTRRVPTRRVPTRRVPDEDKKTKQTAFVFRPVDYESFRKVANMQGVSCNSLINKWVQQYIQENQELVTEYDRLHPEV